jgi:hypothetical protein
LGLSLRFAPPGLAGKAGLSRDAQAVADDLVEDGELVARSPGAASVDEEVIMRRGLAIGSLEELSDA